MLREDRNLAKILQSFYQYLEGKMTIEGLQRNVGALEMALEGTIPKAVRDEVLRAESEIDTIRFSFAKEQQIHEVARVCQELEAVIDDSNHQEA